MLLFLVLLLFGTSCQGMSYKLYVKTKDKFLAGTDEIVSINIKGIRDDGTLVETGFKDFYDRTERLFEKNSLDVLYLNGIDVWNVLSVDVQIKKSGWYLDNWYLDSVTVFHNGNTYLFVFNKYYSSNRQTSAPAYVQRTCRPGLTEKQFNHYTVCRDVDECETSCKGVGQLCKNNPGSYTCTCAHGFFDSGGLCEDFNECLNEHTCSGPNMECYNKPGSYECKCKNGYKMESGVCKDADECVDRSVHKCQQKCVNTEGSFHCACNDGYSLAPDGKSCTDINECVGENKCDPVTSVCYDQVNDFICMCRKGYVPSKTTKNICDPIQCSAVTITDTNVVISPSECSTSGRHLNQKCSFSCKPGFVLRPGTDTYYTCNDEGRWVGKVPPTCRPLLCPKIQPPQNGHVIPADCSTTGIAQGKKCYQYCNNGYKLIGAVELLCNLQKFSPDVGPARCVRIPRITCPDFIQVTLAQDQSTYILGENYPSYTSSLPPNMVSSIPSETGPDHPFPKGSHRITLIAKNEINETATCSFTIRVSDKSPPVVAFCPDDLEITTKSTDVKVEWKEPVFQDNVAVTNIQQTVPNGQVRRPVSFSVQYTASDAENNIAQCAFMVKIKILTCDRGTFRGADQLQTLTCFGAFCTATCASTSKTFDETSTSFVKNFWPCDHGSVNGKDTVFPSCVDFQPKTGASCPDGFIDTFNYHITPAVAVCGKCPRGTYFDKEVKKCRSCGIGLYQDTEGQLGCKHCPSGTTTRLTRNILSSSCVAQCGKGTWSQSGIAGTGKEGCKPCAKNTYTDQLGSKECTPCPSGSSTDGEGKGSIKDCLRPPTVTFSESNNAASVQEGSTVNLLCKGNGNPRPHVSVIKYNVLDKNVPHGTHLSIIRDIDSETSLITYEITGVTVNDADTYSCRAENTQGEERKVFKLVVTPRMQSGSGSK